MSTTEHAEDVEACWRRYLELTEGREGPDYELIESWAWAELQQALSTLARREGG